MNAGVTNSKPDNAKKVVIFFLKLIVIWLSWKLIFYVTGEEHVPVNERIIPSLSVQWENLNNIVRWIVLQGSEHLLNLFGYTTENNGYALRIKGERGIGLGNYCLGFQLIYYFSMLIFISTLGKGQKVIAFITAIPIVIILNIIRIAILCLVVVKRPTMLPAIHDYIFNAVVLGVLFVYYLFLTRSTKT